MVLSPNNPTSSTAFMFGEKGSEKLGPEAITRAIEASGRYGHSGRRTET